MAYKEIDPGPAPEMGTFYKFTAIGQKFAGIFVSFSTEEGNFGKENRWVFRNKDGPFTITANFDLHRRLLKADLRPGHKALIEYLKDAPAKPGQSGMKLFSLKVDSDPSTPAVETPANATPPANDLPF
jgi:hypothetical protein